MADWYLNSIIEVIRPTDPGAHLIYTVVDEDDKETPLITFLDGECIVSYIE